IDLTSDSFVPLYTMARRSGGSRKWTVNIVESKGGQVVYEFTSRSDLHNVQKAFTGYSIATYAENIFSAVTYKGIIRENQFVGIGEIQIWCPPGFSLKKDLPLSPVMSPAASQVTTVTKNSRSAITSILSNRHP